MLQAEADDFPDRTLKKKEEKKERFRAFNVLLFAFFKQRPMAHDVVPNALKVLELNIT